MALDVSHALANSDDLFTSSLSEYARGLRGSAILAVAREVRQLLAEGHTVHNFTIGDFAPAQFAVPAGLAELTRAAYDAGRTNYPPAVGTPELLSGVRALYARDLDLEYPPGSVQVGSGARPPIFAAFFAVVAPGDTVVYPVPSWNIEHYVYLTRAQGIPVVTSPEAGFMPTAADLLPHLPKARMVVLNSPLNPCGTVISEELLRDVCEAIVAENRGRRERGERPCMLLFDQVYWQLVYGDYAHHTPVGLVPEMAPYTIFVDAISKAWAATGLRVGWAVVPPWVRENMRAFVGHMGAWAPRPEQLATAALLEDPALLGDFMDDFRAALERRLTRLHDGLVAMRADGLPVDALDAQGAIYLSARFDLVGRTGPDGSVFETDDDVRSYILREAGVAVVPFTAFGYPDGTGWCRFSVGAVSEEQVDASLVAIREAVSRVR